MEKKGEQEIWDTNILDTIVKSCPKAVTSAQMYGLFS